MSRTRSVKAIAEPAVRREIESETNWIDVRLTLSVIRRATTCTSACGMVSVCGGGKHERIERTRRDR
jgi:hypothetical protein